MLNIGEIDDTKLVLVIDNRWQQSQSLWDLIEKTKKKNEAQWKNQPDWINNVPNKKSKARDNRSFLGMETVITNLTARPTKPSVGAVKGKKDGPIIASDLQEYFLAKVRDLGLKAKMRKGLRSLFLSRLLVLKVFWNSEVDDYDVMYVNPLNVRFSKKATSMYDTDFTIEKVTEIRASALVEKFPDKKDKILAGLGLTADSLITEDPETEYFEAWIGDWVCYKFKDQILYKEKHPYWDFDGVKMTGEELMKFEDTKGQDRKSALKEAKSKQEEYKKQLTDNPEAKFESYLFNHFDKPYAPYVFGTILSLDNKPVGDTTLMEQVESLQYEIDKRKRQISDNAQRANGFMVVDTKFAPTITKADAMAAKSDPDGMLYGDGVKQAVGFLTGRDLPATVAEDLKLSITELDNIFGTGNTFRGEQGPKETATGRAILREQSYQRLDELIDLVDSIYHQLYRWFFQMMKVRYTESHYIKPIGAKRANEVITMTQNDLSEGIEIDIIPGQVMPEDKLFKAERAKEEAVAGLIDPITYFELTDHDNPEELAKRLILYKMNPFSLIKMSDEEILQVQQANKVFAQLQPAQVDEKAIAVKQIRQRAEELMNSADFQKLPPDQQKAALDQLRTQMQKLNGTGAQ